MPRWLAQAAAALLLVACTSDEMKGRRQVAGEYRWELAGDGWTASRTLTLRMDGTATLATALDGVNPSGGSVTGTYAVLDGTLTTRFAEATQAYTVSGDTLFPRLAQRQAQFERITGMKAGDNLGEQALVRVR
jgi:hypothetical protein